MEIWRKFKISEVVIAAAAVALSITALYFANLIYWAMWAWIIAVWLFLFLVPMPIIERNKKEHKVSYVVAYFLGIFLAIIVGMKAGEYLPEYKSFTFLTLTYSVVYAIVMLGYAGWLKLKEER